MRCKHCNNETNEKLSGLCSHCVLPLGGGSYAPPDGFAYDPASGWYYTVEQYREPTNDEPMVNLIWFDPDTAEYHTAQHPDPTGGIAAAPAEPLLEAPPEPPRDFGHYAQLAAAQNEVLLEVGKMPRKGKTSTIQPVEGKQTSTKLLLILAVVVGIGVLGTGVWFLVPQLTNKEPPSSQTTVPQTPAPQTSAQQTPAETPNVVNEGDQTDSEREAIKAEHAQHLPNGGDVSLEIHPKSSNTADFVLSGINLQPEYPTRLNGVEESSTICSWGIEIGGEQYQLSLAYYFWEEKAAEAESFTPQQMDCGLFKATGDGSWSRIKSPNDVIKFAAENDSITFFDVTLPEDAGIDLLTTTEYTFNTRYGLVSRTFPIHDKLQIIAPESESLTPEQERAALERDQRGIPEPLTYFYAFVHRDAEQVTRLMLKDGSNFVVYAQMGGSDYIQTGSYRMEGGSLWITCNSKYPNSLNWEGELEFSIEQDGNLTLQTSKSFGLMSSHDQLLPIVPAADSRQYVVSGMPFGFPYANYYRHEQKDQIYDFYFYDDWSFAIHLTDGGSTISSFGRIEWPNDREDCELVFSTLAGTFYHDNGPRMIASFSRDGETLKIYTPEAMELFGDITLEMSKTVLEFYG